MSALASLRISAKCPQCELPLLTPERSECVSDRRTVHFWHCPICGQDFETADRARTKPAPDDQHVALVA
jgi:endogenous inhibitor of DNA gyrase (YacG/DUF329 family)